MGVFVDGELFFVEGGRFDEEVVLVREFAQFAH